MSQIRSGEHMAPDQASSQENEGLPNHWCLFLENPYIRHLIYLSQMYEEQCSDVVGEIEPKI